MDGFALMDGWSGKLIKTATQIILPSQLWLGDSSDSMTIVIVSDI